jgi:hypothetical protein
MEKAGARYSGVRITETEFLISASYTNVYGSTAHDDQRYPFYDVRVSRYSFRDLSLIQVFINPVLLSNQNLL